MAEQNNVLKCVNNSHNKAYVDLKKIYFMKFESDTLNLKPKKYTHNHGYSFI